MKDFIYEGPVRIIYGAGQYKELKENIESNPVKKAQVEEFEHLRYKIQVETMQGSGNATEAKQMLQEKYAELLQQKNLLIS